MIRAVRRVATTRTYAAKRPTLETQLRVTPRSRVDLIQEREQDGRVGLRRRLLLTCAVFTAALFWAGLAQAGYGIQPAPGATTNSQPTFLAYLDSQDSLPVVYVATTPSMGSYGKGCRDRPRSSACRRQVPA